MIYRQMELPDEGLVLMAGRPGMGKSYVMIEMANELNQAGRKALLVYADGRKSHGAFYYQDGQTRVIPSKLSQVHNVYPDLAYVAEDGAEDNTPHGWQSFLNDAIEHEKADVIFINTLPNPQRKNTADVLRAIQALAKEKHVLIFAEISVSRRVERRKDKYPTPKDTVCPRNARKYADKFVFVYRDSYYDFENGKEPASKTVEVYTDKRDRILLPFYPEKYANSL